MDGYIAYLVAVFAALGGLAILYAQRDVTYPGYKGQGEVWLPVLVASIAIGLVWLIGYLAGSANVFLDMSVSMRFYLTYDDLLVRLGAWTALLGLGFLAGVVTYNTARHGRAVM